MKKVVLFISLIIVWDICFGQSSEFKLHSNGLIYSDSTMHRLRKIVDSLNLGFANCKSDRAFVSGQQAIGRYVTVRDRDIAAAKKDIEANISFDDFIKKYPYTIYEDSLLVLKYESRDYKGNDNVTFYSIGINKPNGHEINIPVQSYTYDDKLKNKWVFYYGKGVEPGYEYESLCGFYFITEFESKRLPDDYSRLINYSICLIDTTSQKIKKREVDDNFNSDTIKHPKIEGFFNYVNKNTNKPNLDSYKGEDYYASIHQWDSTKFTIIDSILCKQNEFRNILKEAVDEAIADGGSSSEFECYVERYYSKNVALDLKLSRPVVGRCSMDNSPRAHAVSIALLSAETANWPVFLRAHLNIMNDRFDRVSDGSYAWSGRKTYLRELEELKINAADLLLGISFQVGNPCRNQYFGSIGRVGRALAESVDTFRIGDRLLNVIKDSRLDDNNRLLFYYLFQNYYFSLKDTVCRPKSVDIINAIHTLPSYLFNRIVSENYDLKTLLRDEWELISKTYDVGDSQYGTISSIDWDSGDCWMATLKPKGNADNVYFDVTMPNDYQPGSIKPLMKQQDSLLARVYKSKFLINIIRKDSSSYIKISFTTDKSFSEKAQTSFREDLPKSKIKKYKSGLNNLAFITLYKNNESSRWLIFPNGDALLWQFSGKSPLENYTKEELAIPDDYFNNCMKRFNPEGKIIN